jgi:hypothetical protein
MKYNFPSITPKTIYYHSNGSGRDHYIQFNNGGVSKNEIHPMPVPLLGKDEY